MNNFIQKINEYYQQFMTQDMDQYHIGDRITDTGYALEGIEMFIKYIEDKEKGAN
jgi:hypothetical protein